MSWLKKQRTGFYITVLTEILLLAALTAYLMNCKTNYYTSFGIDSKLVAFLVLSILAGLLYLVLANTRKAEILTDLLPVVYGVFTALAMVSLLEARAYSIATILTFQNNDNNLADMKGAILAMALCGAALIFSIVSSYLRVVKEE